MDIVAGAEITKELHDIYSDVLQALGDSKAFLLHVKEAKTPYQAPPYACSVFIA